MQNSIPFQLQYNSRSHDPAINSQICRGVVGSLSLIGSEVGSRLVGRSNVNPDSRSFDLLDRSSFGQRRKACATASRMALRLRRSMSVWIPRQ